MQWFFLILLVLLIGWQVKLIRERLRTVQISQNGETHKARGERQRLERAEQGATPKTPLEIASPSVVEPHSTALKCLRCGEQHRLLEHTALTMDGVRLRKALVQCRNCGNRRSLYFRLREQLH